MMNTGIPEISTIKDIKYLQVEFLSHNLNIEIIVAQWLLYTTRLQFEEGFNGCE